MSKYTISLRRGQPGFLVLMTLCALIVASLPMSAPALMKWQHTNKVNSTEYKQQFGYWEELDVPEEFKQNTIHAATLPTGKVLLVAGSGNDRDTFNAYNSDNTISVLATAILDPVTGKIKKIATPADLFCSGHTLLQSGSLLVAGGTSGYELLEGNVTKPAGVMTLHNENPDDSERLFKKGTKFIHSSGKAYLSTQDVVLPPADKMDHGDGHVMVHQSAVRVFVEAEADDSSYITENESQYSITGITDDDKKNVYGMGGPMTLEKQDYRGDNKAYEFDPIKEEYVKVGDMKESRWYASLPLLNNGEVLAVSGLDNVGQITETTEFYNPETKSWRWGPNQPFPTYPALFPTSNPSTLFYSGSNTGYGPADKGRDPGFWNLTADTFQPVSGLRDADMLETSASVSLPPIKGSNDGSQSSRIMVAGGGGIGESPRSTDRTDIIDLAAPNPVFTPGPDLPTVLRYPNVTVMPWDEVIVNGGSTDYRAKGNSYSHNTISINPTNNTTKRLADEPVGRNYHSGSLLLKDGRVLVFGGDPLFGDKNDTTEGQFERRIEIFTPPQLFTGDRPYLNGPDMQVVARGQTLNFTSPDQSSLKYARLIPPSSTTHAMNLEQRSVAAVLKKGADSTVEVTIPSDNIHVPNGWYMLFVIDDDDRSSVAKMVHIQQ